MQNITEYEPLFIRITPGLSEAIAQSLARAHGVRKKWPYRTVRPKVCGRPKPASEEATTV